MAKHHMAHVLALYLGARKRFAHHKRGQVGRGDVFQTAAKSANGGAHGADDYNFTGHGVFPLISGFVGKRWAPSRGSVPVNRYKGLTQLALGGVMRMRYF